MHHRKVSKAVLWMPSLEGVDDPKKELEYDKELRGPKNLAVNLKNTRLEGAVSAASQSYREGLTWIDEKARLELSRIQQQPAPTINNGGVVVTLGTRLYMDCHKDRDSHPDYISENTQ